MNRTEILLHIEELIKKLDEQQHRLQSFSAEIPALESDLLQRQVRQLYEYALELEKMRATLPAPAIAAEPVIAKSVQQIHESPSEHILVEAAKQQEADEEPVHTPSATQTVIPPAHESATEHILVEAAKHNEPVADMNTTGSVKTKKIKGDVNSVLFKDNPTLGDRFEDEPTIHERIAPVNSTSSVASHMQRKPITDLKKAIGLNEKFLFINHLFDGNLQVYNQAIDFLDAGANKENAMEYIQNTLIPQFGWDLQSSPCRLFVELVDRRFLKG